MEPLESAGLGGGGIEPSYQLPKLMAYLERPIVAESGSCTWNSQIDNRTGTWQAGETARGAASSLGKQAKREAPIPEKWRESV